MTNEQTLTAKTGEKVILTRLAEAPLDRTLARDEAKAEASIKYRRAATCWGPHSSRAMAAWSEWQALLGSDVKSQTGGDK